MARHPWLKEMTVLCEEGKLSWWKELSEGFQQRDPGVRVTADFVHLQPFASYGRARRGDHLGGLSPQTRPSDGGRESCRRQPLTSAESPVPAQDLGWWILDATFVVRDGRGGELGTEASICGTEAGALCWGQADSGHRTKKSCGYSPPENAPTGAPHLRESPPSPGPSPPAPPGPGVHGPGGRCCCE